MVRRSTGRRWATRGASTLLASALVLPLAMSGAQAHPDAPHDAAPAQVADDPALEWDNYEKVLVTKNTGEPIDLAVLPDSRVLHTARNGVVRLTDPATGATTQVAQLDVYANSEDGLQGVSLDPDFEENGWVYLVYAPRVMSGTAADGTPYPETTPAGNAPNSLPEGADPETYWDQWLGYNVLSRFQWDAETSTLDLDSEQEIIKVDAQRGQCCHVGADMAWDAEGNLFLSTGDNTPAGTPGANGYTPINNAPGMNPGFDDRRGAGNSNDLRGAILRINPIEEIEEGAEPGPGSTYTIPEGNLFNNGEYDADLVREEIYVMGLRNPFRIDYDIETGALVWGDYGPDAAEPQVDRGPMGYVEWQLTTEPINGGWPYCHGPNEGGAYNEWDFENNAPGDIFFDCENGPVNNSTFNTGLDVLPPVTEPQVYYGDNPGDQPWDEFVEFRTAGGQAPMGGPIYRYDEELDSPTKFPEYWDGKPLMAEFSQDYVAAITMDELSSDGVVTNVENFLPNLHLETVSQPIWDNVMDMEFGPDGSLYVLEYGDGFFRQNPDAGLYRVNYVGDGNKTPQPSFTASPISSSTAPLEVTFDASASRDPEGEELTFEWDFNGDGEFDAEGVEVTHTFADLGQFDVTLRATDPQGASGISTTAVTVGNTAPEITLSIADGEFFNWGDEVTINVSVTDAEDGDEANCDNLSWTFGLGHNQHAHPEVSGSRSCEIVIQTSPDAVEHGEGEKIYGTFVATYRDAEQEQAPSITSEATLILKPEVQQAEWYDAAEGVTVADDAEAGAGAYVTDFEEGDSLTFQPVAFRHAATGEVIDTVTARGAGEGTVFLSRGDDETPFAEIEFAGGEGWQEIETRLSTVPEGTGSVVVTSTGGVDLDALTFTASGEEPPVERVLVPAEDVSVGMFSLIPWVEEAGLPSVLARLTEIGLQNVEPFGGNLAGWTAEEFRAMTDLIGLDVPSSHYDVDEGTFAETLDYVEILGQEYVGSGGFADPGISSYGRVLQTAERMNRLGQASVEAGIGKFFGHNHATEFTTVYTHGGEQMSAWEILVEETDPEYVTFQLDVAWAAHAGVDVPALIEEHGDRIELLHIKDAVGLGEEDGPSFTNLGEGDVDLQGILAAAQAQETVELYVLEYDVAPEGEDFVRTGFEYLTGQTAGEEGSRPVQVTTRPVTFTDQPGADRDAFTVPRVVGVEYRANGQLVEPGTHPGAGVVTVTARAAQGFALTRGAATEWSHTFSTASAPGTGEFHLSNTWTGSTDVRFAYGRTTDEVFIGDWDGDGRDTVALRRGSTFHVSNALRGGDADRVFAYGRPGDVVLVGDWDGNGTDTFAVRRGKEYHVKNSLAGGRADAVVAYGRAEDQVLVGDWDGNGRDTFTVRRGSTYYVKNAMAGGSADVVFAYGRAADVTLAGDWDGDGKDTFAVQRGRTYYVNNALRGGEADRVVTFGRLGDEVVVGDWDGNGTDTLGIRRAATVSAAAAAAPVKEVRGLSKSS
ncbi:PQQ-dependent sugar dehydrogenase [Georgenia phoenicis]|uniref:PQQ-dependent sugar dehydrogenase n=1 Tax=unclassified Georgenia TaxID=2626815 RepID=UPI0039B05A9C